MLPPVASAPVPPRRVRLVRGQADGSFGFVLVGSAPVFVRSTFAGTPARGAGLVPGDQIVGIGAVNVSMADHSRVVALVRAAGAALELIVQYNAPLFESRTGLKAAPAVATGSPRATRGPPRSVKTPGETTLKYYRDGGHEGMRSNGAVVPRGVLSPRRQNIAQSPLAKAAGRAPRAAGRPTHEFPVVYLGGQRARKPECPWSLLYVAYHMTEVSGRLRKGLAVPSPGILSVQAHRLTVTSLTGRKLLSCPVSAVLFTACGREPNARFAVVTREDDRWDRCHVIEGDGTTIVNLLRCIAGKGGHDLRRPISETTHLRYSGQPVPLLPLQREEGQENADLVNDSVAAAAAVEEAKEAAEEEESTESAPEPVPEPEPEPSSLVASLELLGITSEAISTLHARRLATSSTFTVGTDTFGPGRGHCVTVLADVALPRAQILHHVREMQPLMHLQHSNLSLFEAAALAPGSEAGTFDVALRWDIDTHITLHDVLYGGKNDSGTQMPMQRPRTLADGLAVAVAVSQGLAYLHGNGSAHGSISPHAVRISNDGIVKLADTGVFPLMRVAAGSDWRLYAAPEVLAGSDAVSTADVYALGVLVDELTSLKKPVLGQAPRANSTVPRDLKRKLESCWCAPAQRPTADAVNVCITEVLGDLDSGSSADEVGSDDERKMDMKLRSRSIKRRTAGPRPSWSTPGRALTRPKSYAFGLNDSHLLEMLDEEEEVDKGVRKNQQQQQPKRPASGARHRRNSFPPPGSDSKSRTHRVYPKTPGVKAPPAFPSPDTLQASRDMLGKMSHEMSFSAVGRLDFSQIESTNAHEHEQVSGMLAAVVPPPQPTFADTSESESESESESQPESKLQKKPESKLKPAVAADRLDASRKLPAASLSSSESESDGEDFFAMVAKAKKAKAPVTSAARPTTAPAATEAAVAAASVRKKKANPYYKAKLQKQAKAKAKAKGGTASAIITTTTTTTTTTITASSTAPGIELEPEPEPASKDSKKNKKKKEKPEKKEEEEEEKEEEEDMGDFFSMLAKAKQKETEAAQDWEPEDEYEAVEAGDEEVMGPARWGKKFQYLISSEEGVECFIKFLQTIFCEENCRFFLDAQAMKRLPDNEFPEACRYIYDTYFDENAKSPINVDSNISSAIRRHMKSDPPPRNAFALAQKQIYHLMSADSYPKFLKSRIYQRALESGSKDTADRRAPKKVNAYYKAKKAKQEKAERAKSPAKERVMARKKEKAAAKERTARDKAKVKRAKKVAAKEGSAAHDRIASPGMKRHKMSRLMGLFHRRHKDKNGSSTPAESNGVASADAAAADDIARDVSATAASAASSTVSSKDAAPAVSLTESEPNVERSVLFRAILPNQSRSVVQAAPGQSLKVALAKVMGKFRIDPSVMRVRRAGTQDIIPWNTDSQQLEGLELELCPAVVIRLVFPDGSRSEIVVDPAQSVRDALSPSLARQGLSFATHHALVVAGSTRTPVPPGSLASSYADQDIVIDLVPSQPQGIDLNVSKTSVASVSIV